jgi:hypothetical protein
VRLLRALQRSRRALGGAHDRRGPQDKRKTLEDGAAGGGDDDAAHKARGVRCRAWMRVRASPDVLSAPPQKSKKVKHDE